VRQTFNKEETSRRLAHRRSSATILRLRRRSSTMAIPSLIANHFSRRPGRLLSIHFGGGEARLLHPTCRGCDDVRFSSVYPAGAPGENMEAARRQVGENISLPHTYSSPFPPYTPVLSTPASRGSSCLLSRLDVSQIVESCSSLTARSRIHFLNSAADRDA